MQTKIENIPAELKALPCWVCWQGQNKIPKNPFNGRNAQSNNRKTWGTFEQAVKACDTFGLDGLGFMFDESLDYFGVDLDHCIDNADFVDEFVETLESYAEISKSGTGIHIICKGKLPEGANRKNNVEMYSNGRYFIVTGNVYNQKYKEIKDCTETIKVLHNKYLPKETPKAEIRQTVTVELDDSEVIEKARNCKTGTLFSMLYSGQWEGLFPSQSEADLAFCNQLAFWCGKNEAQMDRIFRNSGLMRDKWDKKRGADTYGNMTIGKACAACNEVYEPKKHDNDTSLAIGFFKGKTSTTTTEKQKKSYDMTDTGNAHRLYDRFGDVLKYSHNRKKWYFWNGKQWRVDESGQIKRLADEICMDLKEEAFTVPDEELQQQALKFANKTAGSKPKENFIKECQHLYDIPVNLDEFDKYKDYLNAQNGIINLRNGELLQHNSQYMSSKICNCDYDVDHKKPEKWLKFLDDITNGSKPLQDYIQKCVGYSISGSNREQCVYFLYGLGNNGKSTFLDTLADMLGDYAANTQTDTIMAQSKVGSANGGANTAIARLKSIRFVTSEEPSQGVHLNEGLLKQLSGGSKVTCRFLYGEEFEYEPEFKLWLATNHKPIIRGTDVGIWRRIKLIPFEVNISKERIDKNLKYKLRQEFPQILAWAVEGCIRWQTEGIDEPTEVSEATKDYKQEMDLIASFVEQCIVIDYDNTERILANELFSIYRAWAKANGEYEMSAKRFGMELAKKVPEKVKTSKGVAYCKISLTDYAKEFMPKQYRLEDFK